MAEENRMKVCVVSISLGKGGAERSASLLTHMLYNKGYDVHLVLLNDEIEYQYAGKLLNLGKLKSAGGVKRLLRFLAFRKYLQREKIDYIIDSRNRHSSFKEKFYLKYLYKGFKVIYMIRSSRLSEYLPENEDTIQLMIRNAHKFVAVSKYIALDFKSRFSTQKAEFIYNPVEQHPAVTTIPSEKYILFMGRLVDEVKNISLLLEAYKLSVLSMHGFKLKILGDGKDLEMLQKKSLKLGISKNVEFLPFTADVFSILAQAYFTVLTSKFEGFPRILAESLSVGTPVVSVNCISGPNEIIKHGNNGLLVQKYTPEAFAEAMDRMVLDLDLYDRCKSNSKKSVAHLSLGNIAEKWDKLLRNEK